MIEHTIFLNVRYAETDQMGVAHHSNYAVWFEAARVELMRPCGLSYAEFEKSDYYMPLIELTVRFRKAAHFDDRLSIRVQLKKMPRASIIFDYEVMEEGEGIIASGQTVHAFMNRQERAVKPPKAFLDHLAKFF